MKKILKITTLALALFSASSCEKYVEIDPPIDRFIASTAFESDELVKADIVGLYAYNLLMIAYHDTFRPVYLSLAADEMRYYTTALDEWSKNEWLVTNTPVRNMWIQPYQAIYQCNTIIEALNQTKANVSESLVQEALGVAKFFRALSYLNLVTTFGDVPLVTVTAVKESNVLPRTPVSAIYDVIFKDLEEARVHMKGNTNSRFHVNEQVVAAIQARAYTYAGIWDKAFDHADELISGSLKGNLALEEVEKVFLRSSKETIFAISSTGGNPTVTDHTYLGRTLIHNGVRVVYHVADDLLNAFEANDKRKTNWIAYFSGSAANSGYYFNKYKFRSIPTDATKAEDQILVRLSEMYLIRAEALSNLERLDDAKKDLNTIRLRAGLPELSTPASKSDALLAVEKERRVELFAEYGHRWVDLVRTNRADAVLGALKPSWKSHAKLLPIPELEIQLNPKLVQNPGYGAL